MSAAYLDAMGGLNENQIFSVPSSVNDMDEIETEKGAGLYVIPALLLSVLAMLAGFVVGIETPIPWQFAAAALVMCTGAIVLLTDDSEHPERERRPRTGWWSFWALRQPHLFDETDAAQLA